MTTDGADPAGAGHAFANGVGFVDGAFVPIADARIPILDWGFLRGDATYDVVSVWNGHFFRLHDHLDRFYAGVDELQLTVGLERDQLASVLAECARLGDLNDAYVEMICTRGQPRSGSRDPRECQNAFYAFAVPYVWIATLEKQETEGLHLAVSEIERIGPGSVDPTVKNYHWLDFQKGLLGAFEVGAETVVLKGPDGTLTEGPGFNLFAVHAGVVTTPATGVLKGITRRTAIEIVDQLGIALHQGPLTLEALRTADEVFGTSTAGGILPMTRIDSEPVGDGMPGPLTLQVRDRYWALHEDPAYSSPIASIPAPDPSLAQALQTI